MKENSQLWLGKQQRYVAWWAGKLKGVDLRRATLADHIKPALKGTKAVAHRIATIKAVYNWLRTVKHALTANEDPTFGTLPVPQSDPNKRRMKNKAAPLESLAEFWLDAAP